MPVHAAEIAGRMKENQRRRVSKIMLAGNALDYTLLLLDRSKEHCFFFAFVHHPPKITGKRREQKKKKKKTVEYKNVLLS